MDEDSPQGVPGDAFAFSGTWREYLPIALSNLLLTIVTIGVYRFWAKARERRYLWSRTRFIDDRLEWTGTGREMFVGFLVAMLIFGPLILFIQFGFQALVLRGHPVVAGVVMLGVYVLLLYLVGLARFRALRYRLTRSYWHGIRGGSDEAGFDYAWSSLWKTVIGWIAFGLMVPWAMVQLWNQRWGSMSFGPYRFRAEALAAPLMLRWLLLLFSPIVLIVVGVLVVLSVAMAMGVGGLETIERNAIGLVVLGIAAVAGIYFLMGLIGLFYFAAFLREAIGKLSLGGLDFTFEARSKQWLLLFLGDVALVVCTLGLGICFLGYRHWSFLIRHLGATGEVDLTQLTQSTTRAPRGAEGFADAFDIGAI